jgi:hypothetical protein
LIAAKTLAGGSVYEITAIPAIVTRPHINVLLLAVWTAGTGATTATVALFVSAFGGMVVAAAAEPILDVTLFRQLDQLPILLAALDALAVKVAAQACEAMIHLCMRQHRNGDRQYTRSYQCEAAQSSASVLPGSK